MKTWRGPERRYAEKLLSDTKRRIQTKSKELNTLLLDKFPNLKDTFKKEVSWQGRIETESTVAFEDVFMPYIIYCVEHSLMMKPKKSLYLPKSA